MSHESESKSVEQEEYGLRDTLMQRSMVERCAEKQAAFLLPHLRPGMNLLDCGCGPGSITLGLAKSIAPGMVVGIDMDLGEIERAGTLALEQGIKNVEFKSGTVYELPFADGEFDALFSNALLDHLRDPHLALREMRRVIKAGGVIGVRTADRDGYLYAPADSPVRKYAEWSERLKGLQGVSVRLGKNLRAMLREAGFVRTEASASYDTSGTKESTRAVAAVLAAALTEGRLAERIVDQGLADRAQLELTAAAMRVWGESPDAFAAQSFCEAVGWCDD